MQTQTPITQSLPDQIKQTLAKAKGKYFILPSGQTRRLDDFEIDAKNSTTTLHFEKEKAKSFANLVFLEKWNYYMPISADLAPQEAVLVQATSIPEARPIVPKPAPSAPLPTQKPVDPPAVMAEVDSAPMEVASATPMPIEQIQQHATGLLGLGDLGRILDEQLAKVQRDPKAIAQAKVINDLAKSKIDMARVRVDAIRLLKDLIKPGNDPAANS
ncbi:hypothetical protein G8759_31230 [Spirosoma aureum]|uniref:Uncharacterized protein n=1 Tax=Spirosoma aureum TaxID=2692134 RepID=A0A6G9AWF1_9BACT|nr:hypothetical protein [Spirosoma aureum]QIP16797.1 hypothetical protein G8759_31230 [Spirosoma aureum]